MSLAELLPSVQALPRGEKLRLMQIILADVVGDDAPNMPDQATANTHFVWSPYDAYDAADVLQQALDADRAQTK